MDRLKTKNNSALKNIIQHIAYYVAYASGAHFGSIYIFKGDGISVWAAILIAAIVLRSYYKSINFV